MKQILKSLLKKSGYTVIQTKNLPKVFSLAVDIKRRCENYPIQTIFDVGANVGQTACYFHNDFLDAKIFSFEPVEKTFAELKSNTKQLNRVSCFNHAFGLFNGHAEICLNTSSQLNSLVDCVNKPSVISKTNETIQVKTISTFMQENSIEKIDLLKTDTEGYDLKVIKGAEDYLNKNKISFVLSEVGFREDDFRHTFFMDLYNYLDSKGFQFCALYDIAHYKRSKKFGYCNALFMNSQMAQMWF